MKQNSWFVSSYRPVPLVTRSHCRSVVAHLQRLWVRIPPGAWMSDCCVLSSRVLCDKFITSLNESYRLWCVVVNDLETSRTRRSWPALGRSGEKVLI